MFGRSGLSLVDEVHAMRPQYERGCAGVREIIFIDDYRFNNSVNFTDILEKVILSAHIKIFPSEIRAYAEKYAFACFALPYSLVTPPRPLNFRRQCTRPDGRISVPRNALAERKAKDEMETLVKCQQGRLRQWRI